MKITPIARRGERAVVGPVLAILVIVIGAIMLYKIYKLAEKLCPPPPPPPACPTNSPPNTNGIIITNMGPSADSAWIILGPDTNTPANTMNVMFGMMNVSNTPMAVMVGCVTDNQVGGLSPSNVLTQIQQAYAVAYPGESGTQNGHGEWDQNSDGTWTWNALSVSPTNITYSGGLITVQDWANDATPHTVVLQSSPDMTNWTSLTTNTMTAGQFRLFRDTGAPQQTGFYRSEIVQ